MSWLWQWCCGRGWAKHEDEEEVISSTASATSTVADGVSSESSEDMGKAVSKVSRFFTSKQSDQDAIPGSSTTQTSTEARPLMPTAGQTQVPTLTTPTPAEVPTLTPAATPTSFPTEAALTPTPAEIPTLTPAATPLPTEALTPTPAEVPTLTPAATRTPVPTTNVATERPKLPSDSNVPDVTLPGVALQSPSSTENTSSSSYYPLATPRSPLTRSCRPASPSDVSPARPPPKRLRKESSQYLDYPIFYHEATITYIQDSKVMFIMKGLPGSGKSYIVRKIQEIYQSVPVVVCSADHYFMQDGVYQFDHEKLKEAHEFCQQQAREAAESNKNIIIIDNTNVQNWEMKVYLQMSKEYLYIPLVLEPQTPWAKNPHELAVRNQHDVPENILRKKVKSYQPVQIMYYGWFLNEMDSENVLMKAKNWLYEALSINQFAKDLMEMSSSNYSSPQDLINIYSRDAFRDGGSILHCTAKFTGRGKVVGALEYMDSAVVKSAMGKCFTLSIIGFIITPRTFGARLKLTSNQLELWGNDDNETPPPVHQPSLPNSTVNPSNNTFDISVSQSICRSTTMEVSCEEGSERFHPTSGLGSRAHITLACAPNIKPVTTGFDTIRVVKREQEVLARPDDCVETYQLHGGIMRNYGEGLWTIYPDKVLQVNSMFSAFYV